MIRNLHRIIVMSTGSLLILTLSLWLLAFTSMPVNRPQFSAPARVTAMPSYTILEISSTVRLTGTKRLGMNVGAHVERGGSYLLKNLIRNPGFEAGEYGMIFLTQPGATASRVQADWNLDGFTGRQGSGFWDGATYEIVSGTESVDNGIVISFTQENNLDTFYLDGDGLAPAAGNVIMVQRQVPGYCCAAPASQSFHFADPSHIRPGSPGVQSLRLLTTPVAMPSWQYVIDGYGQNQDQSAGKLLIADGNWHFEIWARAEHAGDRLRVRLRRPGRNDFFSETIPLSTTWQQITRTFAVSPNDDPVLSSTLGITPTALVLNLHLAPNSGAVWVDDIVLSRRGQTNPTVFSDKLVARLQELRPGILRNWGMHQLGSTLDNQLAEPWARRTNGYRPDQQVATQWHYSLHEFLELTAWVGAEPWIVIPPSFSASELQELVAYLAAEPGAHPYAEIRVNLGQAAPWTTLFSTMHLELGNEMWGGTGAGNPFLGASVGGPRVGNVTGGERLGQVADNRFAIIRGSPFFAEAKFNLIIGSQAAVPTRTLEIASQSSHHETMALAPYFGVLNIWNSDEEIFYPLYARSQQDVQPTGWVGAAQAHLNTVEQDTELAIYEINFHTTASGTVPIDVRNDFVTGLGGGLALPLYMLTYQHKLGIRNQNVWRVAAFSNPVARTMDEYVRVFGTLRDLEATGRKRPTWLGTELANRAIRGNLLETNFTVGLPTWVQTPMNSISATLELPLLHAFAYREGDEYAVMLFNLDLTTSHTVELRLPSLPQASATLHTLTGDSIHDDNEESEQVQIATTQIHDFVQNYQLTLAPHSAYVLQWQAEAAQQTVYLPIVLD